MSLESPRKPNDRTDDESTEPADNEDVPEWATELLEETRRMADATEDLAEAVREDYA